MKLTIKRPASYKTPNQLEEAARVLGGQLVELKWEASAPGSYRGYWIATMVISNDVVVNVDPDAGDWEPGWKRLEKEMAKDD